MRRGRVFTPLVTGSTYRRGVYLLLGAVILLPYVLLGTAFAQMLNSAEVPRAATIMLLVITIIIGVIPSMLRGARALEIAAVRSLLDVDLPDPAPNTDLETRLRGALWFGVHLIAGGIVGLTLLIAVPLAVAYLAPRVGVAVLIIAGLLLLLAVVYAIAGMGKLAAVMAPVLLGPSTSERIAALEAKADELAERNRLARELHDSVGHALTVTTVQAAAARRVLAVDPDFAAKALEAIEETGRAAMEDLDHVLGLLQKPAYVVPNKSLRDLEKLIADARSTGLAVQSTVTGPLEDLPPVVSREAYRIVQEGLTNVVKHANVGEVSLRVVTTGSTLEIELTNPLPHNAVDSGGRGLAGMRERVALLGGKFKAGPDGNVWRVTARLPG